MCKDFLKYSDQFGSNQTDPKSDQFQVSFKSVQNQVLVKFPKTPKGRLGFLGFGDFAVLHPLGPEIGNTNQKSSKITRAHCDFCGVRYEKIKFGCEF